MGYRPEAADLDDEVERLLERHLGTAKEWLPHALVPRVVAGGGAAPDGVVSALTVNLLTEDGLPFYVTALDRTFGLDGAWGAWIRRWTAEEMRHATVLRDYIAASGLVDLVELERTRMAFISSAPVPQVPSAVDALVYLALQELATRIAHFNTGRLLPEPTGREVMTRVAADENLHHLFYRDLVTASLSRDPVATTAAIDRQVRHFAMPGAAIPGFAEHARAIADAGVFSSAHLHEQVLAPLVTRHWAPPANALPPDARRVRERTLRFLDNLGRVAARLSGPVTA